MMIKLNPHIITTQMVEYAAKDALPNKKSQFYLERVGFNVRLGLKKHQLCRLQTGLNETYSVAHFVCGLLYSERHLSAIEYNILYWR